MEEVIIRANYDQTITKAVRDKDGNVTGYEPKTHHFTFGKIGDYLGGGFYLKAEEVLPAGHFKLTTEAQKVTIELPALEITVNTKKGDQCAE